MKAAPLLACALAVAALAAGAVADEAGGIFLEGVENFRLREPALEVFRPEKTWTFIDVPAQRAQALKERSTTEVEREFGALHGRLWHPDTRALVSIHVIRTGVTTPPEPARIEADLRADIGRRKGAQLLEIGRLMVAGADAVKVDWTSTTTAAEQRAGSREPAGGAGPIVYHNSRVDIPRPRSGATISIVFEVQQERFGKVKADWLKLLRKLKLS